MGTEITRNDLIRLEVQWGTHEAVIMVSRENQAKLTKQICILEKKHRTEERYVQSSLMEQERMLRSLLEGLPLDHPLYTTQFTRTVRLDKRLHPERVIPLNPYLRGSVVVNPEPTELADGELGGLAWGYWANSRQAFVRTNSDTSLVGVAMYLAHQVCCFIEKLDYSKFLEALRATAPVP